MFTAGAGKSVLTYVILRFVLYVRLINRESISSAIIENINGECDAGLAHTAIFFFDFKDTKKQDARALLSSLIVQLSNQSRSFHHTLFAFYSVHQNGSREPSIGALTKCLEDILKTSGNVPVYLILDAIDECPNAKGIRPSRRQVLDLVEKLVTLCLPRLHLCITSRPEVDIRTSLEPLTSPPNRISLHDQSGQKKDIVDFVRAIVYSNQNMRRWRDEDKQLVIETLSEKADGM